MSVYGTGPNALGDPAIFLPVWLPALSDLPWDLCTVGARSPYPPSTDCSVSRRQCHSRVSQNPALRGAESLPHCHPVPLYPDPLSVVQEPLGFRCARFPRALSLLMPTFSFHAAPAHLPVNIHRRHQCSPTDPFGSHVFGAVLYARSSSTRHRSTSELLRTL